MGTVYLLPAIENLSFNNFIDGSYSNLDNQQLYAYNTLINSGKLIYDGVANINAPTRTAKLYHGATGTIYLAYFKGLNGSVEVGIYVVYAKTPSTIYLARNTSDGLYSIERTVYEEGFYKVQSVSYTPIQSFVNAGIDCYETRQAAEEAMSYYMANYYPITYHYTDSTVSGPSEAAVGDTVTVSAVPDVGYGITDASTQILVTNNDVAVPYTWDATNQRITFTMPDPT